MIESGTHLVDDEIYLNEDRFAEPKELFKFIGDIIADCSIDNTASLLDVGCATGEFLHYIGGRFNSFTLSGFDISKNMVEVARTKNSRVNFWTESLINPQFINNEKYQIVTNIGVLSFFNEKELVLALKNLIQSVKEDGLLLIHTMINPYPIDVIMKYRRSSNINPDIWEGGWNIFSKTTIEGILNSFNCELEWTWYPWKCHLLEKKTDPMRAWTIGTDDNPFQRVNGASQLIHRNIKNKNFKTNILRG